MLLAAESFGHPQGWSVQERFVDRTRILDVLSEDVRGRVDAILSEAAAFFGVPQDGFTLISGEPKALRRAVG